MGLFLKSNERLNEMLFKVNDHRGITEQGHSKHCLLTIQQGIFRWIRALTCNSRFKRDPSKFLEVGGVLTDRFQHVLVLDTYPLSNNLRGGRQRPIRRCMYKLLAHGVSFRWNISGIFRLPRVTARGIFLCDGRDIGPSNQMGRGHAERF